MDPTNTRDRVVTERYTWLVGHMLPTGSVEAFQVVSDFTSLLFWHDDMCDESEISSDPRRLAELFRRELDLLLRRADPRPDAPLELALCDLRDRFERLAPDPGWMLRFVASMQDYFDACSWEAENRWSGVIPPTEDFVPLRPFAGALWVYLHFIDLLLGRSLPLAIREHPDVRRLRLITCNVVCWHNDVYSLPKELAAGDVHNLVLVYQKELDLPLPEALELATRHSNAELDVFEVIAAKLRRHGRPPPAGLDGYIHALEVFIRGAWEWSRSAERYTPVGQPYRDETVTAA